MNLAILNDATKERLRRYAPKIGYPIFYLFCFIVFLSWTFPYDKLKERLVATFNAEQRAATTPQELSIEELGPSFVTGVEAIGIRLVSPSHDPKKPNASLLIDKARARISLLGLLVGNKNVTFSVEAFDGAAEGSFADSGKARAIDLTFDGMDLAHVATITESAGFPLAGRLYGTLKLDLPEGKASKANGTIDLEVREMFAGDDKGLTIKTQLGPFTLPRLKIGHFVIAGEAKDGVLKLSKIGASGGDVDVVGDGRVQLRERATDAHLDVNLKFKINDTYRMKDDKTQLLFGTPDGKQKPMIEMTPDMARAKTADGYYALRIGGTLAKPVPQSASGGAPSTSSAPTAPSFGAPSGDRLQ